MLVWIKNISWQEVWDVTSKQIWTQEEKEKKGGEKKETKKEEKKKKGKKENRKKKGWFLSLFLDREYHCVMRNDKFIFAGVFLMHKC